MICTEDICSRLAQGMNAMEIAEEYDISLGMVRTIGAETLKQTGRIERSNCILDEEIDYVRASFKETSVEEMAAFLGRTPKAVVNIIKKNDIHHCGKRLASYRERRERERELFLRNRERGVHNTDCMGAECGNWEWLKQTYVAYKPNQQDNGDNL